MHDPTVNTSPASSVDAVSHSDSERDRERNRLVEDLAHLVVRQHRRQQRADHTDDPTVARAPPEPA
jgi:hypothetical protein